MTSAPTFTLDRRTVLHLAPDQSVSTLLIGEDSWAQADPVPELQDGRIMCVFAYETSWTWWERHPVGAEFVLVLSGAAVFRLQQDEGSGCRSIARAEGECLLIPEGAWHRAEITTPSSMLFVTPSPAFTQHRDA